MTVKKISYTLWTKRLLVYLAGLFLMAVGVVFSAPNARLPRVMAKYGLNESQARAHMSNTDQARARHYKYFTGRTYGSQQYYHLAVDSAQVGVDGAVELIQDAIRLWCQVRGTDPLSLLS